MPGEVRVKKSDTTLSLTPHLQPLSRKGSGEAKGRIAGPKGPGIEGFTRDDLRAFRPWAWENTLFSRKGSTMKITVETPIVETARVAQVRGMFDLPATATSQVDWEVSLPLDERPWNVGLIVGPSGCGKSTIARTIFGDDVELRAMLDERTGNGTVIDAFPPDLSIREAVELLSATGFSSPPAWLRPFRVLSTGQQFRVTLALLLAFAQRAGLRNAGESTDDAKAARRPIVFDEFTSVVDRTVAKVGSCALAKAVRARGLRFVAVTCHYDVEDWLQPDWTFDPSEGRFSWRRLRRRPAIELEIVRCQASAWRLFAPHHYLSHSLNPSAVCFLASWNGRPAAFSAWLPFFGPGPRTRREHRTVTLPDFQGVGIGNAISDFIASLWAGQGLRATSTTTHPAMMRSRLRSGRWRMIRKPSFAGGPDRRVAHATTRLTAGFEYTGPSLAPIVGRALLERG